MSVFDHKINWKDVPTRIFFGCLYVALAFRLRQYKGASSRHRRQGASSGLIT